MHRGLITPVMAALGAAFLAGDPAKAARAMLRLIAAPNPPTHLLLGPDALRFVREGMKAFEAEIAAWEEVTTSTDFD